MIIFFKSGNLGTRLYKIKMKFLLVIAGLCGVALAGGNEVRNQDYGQHGSQVFSQ